MSELKIGYARVSTDAQYLLAHRDALQALGVDAERIYVDHGLTDTHRDRPGVRQALAACRRRHVGGDQARPARAVAARRPGDRRRAHRS